MDVSMPITTVIPSLDGPLLEVPGGYVLNRDHVAAPAVELLANLHGELTNRIRHAVERWDTSPALVGVFGSTARRDGDASSDVDVLVVSEDPDLDAHRVGSESRRDHGRPLRARDGGVMPRPKARTQTCADAVDVLGTVSPGGSGMAEDLQRLLNRKDDSQYGVAFVSIGEASRMVGWAKRLLGNARRAVEA